ncbi:MAG: hypothetical protein QP772_00210 [Actinomycetaceae bacterium UMB1218B]|nr:hypothetical protein [Actinomycetaceae bacterium UMB1218B]
MGKPLGLDRATDKTLPVRPLGSVMSVSSSMLMWVSGGIAICALDATSVPSLART